MVSTKRLLELIFKYNDIVHKILVYSLAFTMIYVFAKINFQTNKIGMVSINSFNEAKFETFLIILFLKTCIIKMFESGFKPNKEKQKC